MTKNDKKAISCAAASPAVLIRTICAIHRSGSAKTQAECLALAASLSGWKIVNGCMVAE